MLEVHPCVATEDQAGRIHQRPRLRQPARTHGFTLRRDRSSQRDVRQGPNLHRSRLHLVRTVMIDPKTYFDRCVVISLKRTPQRLESFWQRIDACNWPFIRPIVYDAIDGKLFSFPPWWHCGHGAWGAMRSHLNVIESALNDGIQRLLVMEDDAAPCDQFTEKAIAFLDSLPSNAEIV